MNDFYVGLVEIHHIDSSLSPHKPVALHFKRTSKTDQLELLSDEMLASIHVRCDLHSVKYSDQTIVRVCAPTRFFEERLSMPLQDVWIISEVIFHRCYFGQPERVLDQIQPHSWIASRLIFRTVIMQQLFGQLYSDLLCKSLSIS